jgi:nickel-dependent lactate racemase
VVIPKQWQAVSQGNLVEAALNRPIGVPRLSELARESRNAVIVTCDRTRGVPSRVTIPLILKELLSGRMDPDHIRVLVATGLHKGETMTDVRERLGGELLDKLKVEIHDSDDSTRLADLGKLSSGTPLLLNRSVTENDLVIVESNVEPHFFAGFTGGSKVILPGVVGTETILRNHCWKNIDNPTSRYGMVENPIRADANEALRHVGKVFALNVVLDLRKRIVRATAGDPVSSFNDAAESVRLHSSVQVRDPPDLVITTNAGYPLDRNVYQCVKGIAVPEGILHENSRIIMVGDCADGVGHQDFLRLMASDTPEVVYDKLRQGGALIRDQWEVQVLCRVLQKTPVCFITRPELAAEIRSMHMGYAQTIEQALDSVNLRTGERVLVLPQGPMTLPSLG